MKFGRSSPGATFLFRGHLNFYAMNRILLPSSVLTLLFAGFLNAPTWAQSSGSFPYNPDANENGLVESADLLEFLTFYGAAFQASGVLPVQGGGTGVSTVDSAKVVLGVSTYTDITPAGQVGPTGQITGSLNITQRLAQGFGTDASGTYAQAQGRNTTASGAYSFACNQNSTATATCSSAIGEGSTATAVAAHSQGFGTNAEGLASHAEGYYSDATSNYAHAEGYRTDALNTAAHSEGYQSEASGLYSHAENRNTVASGTSSHAEGQATTASSDGAHSEGYETVASGFASHAEGYATTASGLYSHASGRSTAATGNSATAIGYNVIADQENSTVVGQWNLEGQTGVLFAVGNGADADNRSDALQVDNLGNLTLSGSVVANGQDLLSLIATLQAQVDSLTQQVAALEGN